MNDACAIVHDSVESDVSKNASVLTMETVALYALHSLKSSVIENGLLHFKFELLHFICHECTLEKFKDIMRHHMKNAQFLICHSSLQYSRQACSQEESSLPCGRLNTAPCKQHGFAYASLATWRRK